MTDDLFDRGSFGGSGAPQRNADGCGTIAQSVVTKVSKLQSCKCVDDLGQF